MPSTTSSAAEDAAPAQHSHRRAGVIRQAQPEAPGQQLAASHAAAEKRKANKMTPMERRAKRAADEKRRSHEKRKATREAATNTSKELTGSLEEQNDQWDNYKRNFRARGDTAPLERRYVCQPLWDDLQ